MTYLVDTFLLILELSIMAAVLAGLVFILRWALKSRISAGWVCALWMVVLLRLIIPVSLSSSLSLFNAIPVPSAQQMQAYDPGQYFVKESPLSVAEKPESPQVEPVIVPEVTEVTASVEAAPSTTMNVAEPQVETPMPAVSPSAKPFDLWEVLASLWIVGVVITLLFSIISALHLTILVKKHTQIIKDQNLLEQLEHYRKAMGIKRPVKVLRARFIKVAAVYGWLRPRILLPIGLQPSQVKHVLLHELAHIKRHDILLCYVMIVLRALHWFNPMVWLAFSAIKHDREPACDAMVLKRYNKHERYEYGMTLIDMSAGIKRTCPSHMAAIFESKKQVKERVKHVSRFKKPTIISSVLALIIIVILTACGMSVDKKSNQEITNNNDTNIPKPTLSEALTSTQNTSSIASIQYLASLVDDPFSDFPLLRVYLYNENGSHRLQKEYRVPDSSENIQSMLTKLFGDTATVTDDGTFIRVQTLDTTYSFRDNDENTRVIVYHEGVDIRSEMTTAIFELLNGVETILPEGIDHEQPLSTVLEFEEGRSDLLYVKNYDSSTVDPKDFWEFYLNHETRFSAYITDGLSEDAEIIYDTNVSQLPTEGVLHFKTILPPTSEVSVVYDEKDVKLVSFRKHLDLETRRAIASLIPAPEPRKAYTANLNGLMQYIADLVIDPFTNENSKLTSVSLADMDGKHITHENYLLSDTHADVVYALTTYTGIEPRNESPDSTEFKHDGTTYTVRQKHPNTEVSLCNKDIDVANNVTNAMFDLLASIPVDLPNTITKDHLIGSYLRIEDHNDDISYFATFDISSIGLDGIRQYFKEKLKNDFNENHTYMIEHPQSGDKTPCKLKENATYEKITFQNAVYKAAYVENRFDNGKLTLHIPVVIDDSTEKALVRLIFAPELKKVYTATLDGLMQYIGDLVDDPFGAENHELINASLIHKDGRYFIHESYNIERTYDGMEEYLTNLTGSVPTETHEPGYVFYEGGDIEFSLVPTYLESKVNLCYMDIDVTNDTTIALFNLLTDCEALLPEGITKELLIGGGIYVGEANEPSPRYRAVYDGSSLDFDTICDFYREQLKDTEGFKEYQNEGAMPSYSFRSNHEFYHIYIDEDGIKLWIPATIDSDTEKALYELIANTN